jgi:hypothetical protein
MPGKTTNNISGIDFNYDDRKVIHRDSQKSTKQKDSLNKDRNTVQIFFKCFTYVY